MPTLSQILQIQTTKITLKPAPPLASRIIQGRLDTRHRLIEYREMFHGTIDSASVYPREVVKEALRLNAAAVILSHNHPSGSSEPSQADKVLTQRLKEALAMVEVRTLDHIIVAGAETVSFAEHGLI